MSNRCRFQRRTWLCAALLNFALNVSFVAGCNSRPQPPPSGITTAPQSAPDVTLRFRNVAVTAGIRFLPDKTLKPPLDILQTAGYGGGFLDYDGDGWLDILLVGNPRCALYRNLGNSRFQDVTASAGLDLTGHWMGCASADYDNDGKPDLFLSGYRSAALLHNEGGRFRRAPLSFPKQEWSTSAVFFDYDGDSWLDLYVGGYVQFDATTPRFCPSEGVPLACSPSHYDAQRGHLFQNLKGTGFREATLEARLIAASGKTLGVAACDYDGDGKQDLYLANDGMPGDLFHNLGGRFENVGLESGTAFNREGAEQAGMGVDWGDCNGDSLPDLIVTTFQFEPTSLYLNGGKGTFREEGYLRGLGDSTINTLGFGVKLFDADNDLDQDLLIANGHVQDGIGKVQPGVTFPQRVQLFQWSGDRFQEVLSQSLVEIGKSIVGRAVATGDYDNDGQVDLLVTDLLGRTLLLHNQTQSANHWLSLRLDHPPGPRDATGAKVTVSAGNRGITRFVGTGGGYLSCSDARLHLGLGAATQVETLTVEWPNGDVSNWRNLPVDREIQIQPTSGSSG